MAVPQNKAELLKAINGRFDKLLGVIGTVPAGATDEASMEGHAKGTQMSPANLVAYLVGWNELVLKWLDLDEAGRPIDFPETGYKWNELGLLAQKFYVDFETVPFPELVDRLKNAKSRIVAIIESKDDGELYERSWYDKWTMGRMIQFNTASPYDNARGRLRKWLKAWG